MSIVQNFENIKKELIDNHINSKIIAVSKTFDLSYIQPLLDYGHLAYGENRVQEAKGKWEKLLKINTDIELHLIGGLQTNKAKDAVKLFKFIHSVDREKLVNALADAEENLGLKRKYFLQVNTGEEIQKSGSSISNIKKLYDFAKNRLDIIGLMCIPPVDDDSKKHFEILRELSNELSLNELSMGMSHDYIEAGKCGATYVRIGSKIFGQRG
ncbi:MAG: YggS family pyridoxal phosphate-dependent enzyme [Pelagibacteraceae bacterium]